MTIQEYINKSEEIARIEFMTHVELVKAIGIAYNTFLRVRRWPNMASPRTMKKFKKFVEEWEKKHKHIS